MPEREGRAKRASEPAGQKIFEKLPLRGVKIFWGVFSLAPPLPPGGKGYPARPGDAQPESIKNVYGIMLGPTALDFDDSKSSF